MEQFLVAFSIAVSLKVESINVFVLGLPLSKLCNMNIFVKALFVLLLNICRDVLHQPLCATCLVNFPPSLSVLGKFKPSRIFENINYLVIDVVALLNVPMCAMLFLVLIICL